MSSLQSILNPQQSPYGERTDRPSDGWPSQSNDSLTTLVPTLSHYSTLASNSSATLVDPPTSKEYIHLPHENCPNHLDCLPDSDASVRPQHTLPIILRCAILGSPAKRLTIREIYATMENKYPYFKTAGSTWKQSVRHHLSLNRIFERKPRPVTDPGFGSYWTVNLSAPPGTKRPRKRGKQNKNKDKSTPGGVKRRGRPKKSDTNIRAQSPTLPTPPPPPVSRCILAGPSQPVQSARSTSSYSPSPRLREAQFTDHTSHDVVASTFDHSPYYTSRAQMSDEYYDTEEDILYLNSPSTNSISPNPSSPRSLDTMLYSSASASTHSASLVTQLHEEIQELRRQASYASSESARISRELYETKTQLEQLRNRNEYLECKLQISHRQYSYARSNESCWCNEEGCAYRA